MQGAKSVVCKKRSGGRRTKLKEYIGAEPDLETEHLSNLDSAAGGD